MTSYVDKPMTLEQLLFHVERYQKGLPYMIRYRVGQEDDGTMWVQAWETSWEDQSREPQIRYGQKIEVVPEAGPKGLYALLFEASQELMQ